RGPQPAVVLGELARERWSDRRPLSLGEPAQRRGICPARRESFRGEPGPGRGPVRQRIVEALMRGSRLGNDARPNVQAGHRYPAPPVKARPAPVGGEATKGARIEARILARSARAPPPVTEA